MRGEGWVFIAGTAITAAILTTGGCNDTQLTSDPNCHRSQQNQATTCFLPCAEVYRTTWDLGHITYEVFYEECDE